jgi:hypothetical protein
VTGPHQTYATSWTNEQGFARTLGTGECDFTGGDVVLTSSKAVDKVDESMIFVTTRFAGPGTPPQPVCTSRAGCAELT